MDIITISSTHHYFANHLINSLSHRRYLLMIFQIHQSWITSLKAKIREYPSGLEPDLKPRKALIYLSYYTLTYSLLTSILHTPRGMRR